ncbi:MAG: UDP-N-acetylmuramoyl-tripeptide--D-alanyl-D-alanine ligase [Legionellales bacterium]|nr:UDP-N-acetylmuramoyl-tripeptide--D-alanyl-D-alanine ligase [Legionellales bacterium]
MGLSLKLSQLAAICQGQVVGNDINIEHITIDTRELKPHHTFLALQGEVFDGHNFIQEAQARGANALIVEKKITTTLPYLLVKNTRQALGKIAAFHRQQFSIPLIALTGSCGKTTTRALLASICQSVAPTLSSIKSFNNDIGVPLTLLNLNSTHHYAVLEMGMNHFGEIAYLTQLAQPSVAMILNVGPVHLEAVNNEEGVARAKGEIFQGLTQQGVAVLNADSEFVPYWKTLLTGQSIITFGFHPQAMVRAHHIQLIPNQGYTFLVTTPAGETEIHLPLYGEHNIHNALGAIAAALAVNIDLTAIQHGLSNATPEKQRLVKKIARSGAVVIDDTYNANPQSIRAAIDVLVTENPGFTKVLVLSDMKELGENALRYHQEIGEYALARGVDQFYACGELMQQAVKAFGTNAQFFQHRQDLIQALQQLDNSHMILIKGSRSTHMEHIVTALTEEE